MERMNKKGGMYSQKNIETSYTFSTLAGLISFVVDKKALFAFLEGTRRSTTYGIGNEWLA